MKPDITINNFNLDMKFKFESLTLDKIEIIKESLNEIEAEYVLATLAAISTDFTYFKAINEIIDNVEGIYSDEQAINAIQTIGLIICHQSILVGKQIKEDLGQKPSNSQILEYFTEVSEYAIELLTQALDKNQFLNTQLLGTSEIIQLGSE